MPDLEKVIRKTRLEKRDNHDITGFLGVFAESFSVGHLILPYPSICNPQPGAAARGKRHFSLFATESRYAAEIIHGFISLVTVL
ncbi:hypothetical protein [Methanoculleus sp.]|uniref:hypothetical protein n=1 Tax=Methanoculleus sp. TaxID=90427 RepID=UPI0025E35184|nr:hypothetical protein [Methanoculleus sp.]